MKANLLLIFFSLIIFKLNAQIDTILIYNFQEHQLTKIPLLLSDTFDSEDFTFSNIGNLNNHQNLPLYTPSINLIPGTEFTNSFPITDSVDSYSYPARTAVRINYYRNNGNIDSMFNGILVGSNKILTTSLWDQSNNLINNIDSVIVFPIDEYLQSNNSNGYKSTKAYFKKTIGNELNLFTILELDEAIGDDLGWVGCGYTNSDSLILARQYYKLSYPDSFNVFDPPNNGDTLKLNYGKMGYANSNLGILRLNSGTLLHGMTGSSLFYKQDDNYIAIGIASFYNYFNHQIFTNNNFYLYKLILESNALGIDLESSGDTQFIYYPNPANTQCILKTSAINKICKVLLFDLCGKNIYQSGKISSEEFNLETYSFNSGIYFIQIFFSDKSSEVVKLSIVH